MTRRSRRELEQAVDDMAPADGWADVDDLMWANLKDYYDGDLTPREQRLLEDPESHLTEEGKRHAAKIQRRIDERG